MERQPRTLATIYEVYNRPIQKIERRAIFCFFCNFILVILAAGKATSSRSDVPSDQEEAIVSGRHVQNDLRGGVVKVVLLIAVLNRVSTYCTDVSKPVAEVTFVATAHLTMPVVDTASRSNAPINIIPLS